MHCASCPYAVVVHEAPKKAEAPKIGVKPTAPKVVALNANGPAVAAKTAAPKAAVNSIPRIVCGIAKKVKKESSYREQGDSFLKEPTEIPLHYGTAEVAWPCHL